MNKVLANFGLIFISLLHERGHDNIREIGLNSKNLNAWGGSEWKWYLKTELNRFPVRGIKELNQYQVNVYPNRIVKEWKY